MARGGTREGAGRPRGQLNRATVEQKATLSELARTHATEALEALSSVMKYGKSEAARVSAAIAILDRAFGRPHQMVPEIEEKEDSLSQLLRSIQESQTSRIPIKKTGETEAKNAAVS